MLWKTLRESGGVEDSFSGEQGNLGGPGVEVEDGQLSNLGIQATPNCGTCRKGKTSRILKTPISSGHQPCHGRGGVDGGRVMVRDFPRRTRPPLPWHEQAMGQTGTLAGHLCPHAWDKDPDFFSDQKGLKCPAAQMHLMRSQRQRTAS